MSAPGSVPTGNVETYESGFKLTVHDLNKNETADGYIACGPGPCEFRLDHSQLYGLSSDGLQYVDCNDQLIINAITVNQSCLSFDAGFSFDSAVYFYYGDKGSWWLCPNQGGFFISSQGGDCEEKILWTIPL